MIATSVSEKLIASVYKRSYSWVLDHFTLLPIVAGSPLDKFDHAQSNLAFATNQGFELDSGPSMLIVGGPCLGYSEGLPERLSLDVVADIIAPLTLARWCGSKCLIYLNIAEEAMVTAGHIGLDTWVQLGNGVQQFVERLADYLEVSSLHILRTDRSEVDEAIRCAVARHDAELVTERIGDLYAIGSSGQASYHDEMRLAQYRRNVVSYLPPVLRDATGLDIGHLVAAENMHQVKAINLARELLRQYGPRNQEASVIPTDRIDHVVYLSPPSVTGTRRMARAGHGSSIYVLERLSEQQVKLGRMVPGPTYYWEHIWPQRLRDVLSTRGAWSVVDTLMRIRADLQRGFALPERGGEEEG